MFPPPRTALSTPTPAAEPAAPGDHAAAAPADGWRAGGRWLLLAVVVGILAGLGAAAFTQLERLVARVPAVIAGFDPPGAVGEPHRGPLPFEPSVPDAADAAGGFGMRPFSPWLLVLVATGGGLVSGLLVTIFAPEAAGAGTDAAVEAFHRHRGRIDRRVPLVKVLASAVTLGTGGSGGREGPIAQIGAGLGSELARRLKLSARERRLLLAAGMGAGVGAVFRAPLAGALFAAEILYSDSDFETDAVMPAAVASIVAYSVFVQTLPPAVRYLPLFGSDLEHTPGPPVELLFYAALAVLLAGAGWGFTRAFAAARLWWSRTPIPRFARPACGAGLAAAAGVGLWELLGRDPRVLGVLGTGYGTLQAAMSDPVSVGAAGLLAVAVGKVLTTTLTIGSGGSGGVFGPSMTVGGCLGGAFGLGCAAVFPNAVPRPETFAVVGMAGFFAGCARAPVSTVVMVHELTGDYGLLPPSMLVCTLCFVLLSGDRGRAASLYGNQVPARQDSPAHRGEFLVDVLGELTVDEVYDRGRSVLTVPEAASLDEIVHLLARTRQATFPVRDATGHITGVFNADDVRAHLFDEGLWQLAVAGDVMTPHPAFVFPADDLNTALKRLTSQNLEELPVVNPLDHSDLLGMLRRREITAAYNRRVSELRSDEEP